MEARRNHACILYNASNEKYLLQLHFQLSLCIPPTGRLERRINTDNVAARLRTVVEPTLVGLLLQWQLRGLAAGQLLSPVAEVTRRSFSQLSGDVAAWARAKSEWLV